MLELRALNSNPIPEADFDFGLNLVAGSKVVSIGHLEGCACAGCSGENTKFDNGEGGPIAGEVVSFADVPGSTGTTATLAPGAYIQGEIEIAADSDWYRITLVAGQTYTFSTILAGTLSDSVLRLRDAGGNELATNDDVSGGSGNLFSEITYTATVSGDFYLDVTGFDTDTGTFFLTATSPVADTVAGSAATTAALTIGAATTNDALQSTGDHDWFAVSLVAGQIYEFTTANGGGANIDTTLMLRNASGALVGYNDDSSATNIFSRIRFAATASGTYYLDVGAWGNASTGNYTVQAAIAPPLQLYTNDQIATQLTNTYWGGSQRHWNVAPGGTITVNITALTATAQILAREALNLWTDATGINFSEIATGGQMVFDDNQSGAFASSTISGGIITSSAINVSESWLTSSGSTLRSYTFQAFIHEIGHALGLGHGGNYNGNADYAQDASYLNDSWATTIMSYFDQTENTYFNGQGFTRQVTVTPLVSDIIATTNLYGTASTTRTGNSVYGVGNNTGRAVYDATAVNTPLTITIVDHGGTDTLDYSIYGAAQRIDLNPEAFSNVGGRVGNLTIARGTTIENALGGSGVDILLGNAVRNELYGLGGADEIYGLGGDDYVSGGEGADYVSAGEGNDLIFGGAGADTIVGGNGDDSFYEITSDDLIVEYDGQGNDRIYTEVDYTLRAGSYIETLGTTSNMGTANINLTGNELNNVIIGNNGVNQLDGGAGSDTLYGGAGLDYFYFSSTLSAGSVDTLGDFASVDDILMIDRRVFIGGGLAAGFLDASAFLSAAGMTSATSAAHRFVHDSATGDIYFDADGAGGAAAVKFANIGSGTAIQYYDLYVI